MADSASLPRRRRAAPDAKQVRPASQVDVPVDDDGRRDEGLPYVLYHLRSNNRKAELVDRLDFLARMLIHIPQPKQQDSEKERVQMEGRHVWAAVATLISSAFGMGFLGSMARELTKRFSETRDAKNERMR